MYYIEQETGMDRIIEMRATPNNGTIHHMQSAFIVGLCTIGVIALLGAMSPGPDTAIVIRNSLARSRQAGIATAIGIMCGLLFYVSLVLLGLGAIIAASAMIFTIIKCLGALYLIYLGIQMLRTSVRHEPASNDAVPHRDAGLIASFKDGLFTNLANPKSMIFLLAVFTQVISPASAFATRAAYGLEIPLIVMTWFIALSILVTMPAIRARVSLYLKYVERLMGLALIGLGLKIAVESSR